MNEAVFDSIRERLGETALEATVAHGTLALRIEPSELLAVARVLKDQFGFDLLLDVTAVDWPERVPRFDVVWHW